MLKLKLPNMQRYIKGISSREYSKLQQISSNFKRR